MKPTAQPSLGILFTLGLSIGTVIGIVIGALFTFWWGIAILQTFQRTIRRINKDGDHPSFELLQQ
ncbi:MAG: hypothetical protein HC893_08370 [Chloroflexaceae bacterium]|nr:hypothetical protein [Chloroflexaceae bacterium]NJL33861.1 hypothetical protein [Chloroflexaceae bacterium]NJO04614.1 hypothetical protein [Chloroflexaceae bacterium]